MWTILLDYPEIPHLQLLHIANRRQSSSQAFPTFLIFFLISQFQLHLSFNFEGMIIFLKHFLCPLNFVLILKEREIILKS